MIDAAADALRLSAVPLFGVAAVMDWRTRRVPNAVWGVGLLLAAAALALDGLVALNGGSVGPFVSVAIGAVLLFPLAYIAWGWGYMGGADAKGVMVLALLVPVAPLAVPSPPPNGLFALTVFVNAVLVGVVLDYGLAALQWLRTRERDPWGGLAVPFMVPLVLGLGISLAYGSILFAVV